MLNSLAIMASGSVVDLDSTVFIQLGIFLITFLFLRTFLFKPIIALIAARRKATFERVDEAKKLNIMASELETQIEQSVAEVRKSTSNATLKIVKNANTEVKDMLDQTRKGTRKMIDDSRESLLIESKKVKSDLQNEVNKMASFLVTKMLGRASSN